MEADGRARPRAWPWRSWKTIARRCSRQSKSGLVHEIVPHGGHGPIQEILGSTAIATQAQLLTAKTRRKADGTTDDPSVVTRRSTSPASGLPRWPRHSKSHGQRVGRPDAFKVHDLVFRIAGVGSLGVRRYLALVEGDGPPQGYHLLDIKEARPSAVAPCATDALAGTADDDARRVVLAQTILQGHVAVGLDVLVNRPASRYRMREMIPSREPIEPGPVPEAARQHCRGPSKPPAD